jgi:hypothetical protein
MSNRPPWQLCLLDRAFPIVKERSLAALTKMFPGVDHAAEVASGGDGPEFTPDDIAKCTDDECIAMLLQVFAYEAYHPAVKYETSCGWCKTAGVTSVFDDELGGQVHAKICPYSPLVQRIHDLESALRAK